MSSSAAHLDLRSLGRIGCIGTSTVRRLMVALLLGLSILASAREVGAVEIHFDTRFDGPEVLTGRASLGISRRLRHHGFAEVAAPKSFVVDHDNSLLDGEVARAHQWAESVLESLLADAAH